MGFSSSSRVSLSRLPAILALWIPLVLGGVAVPRAAELRAQQTAPTYFNRCRVIRQHLVAIKRSIRNSAVDRDRSSNEHAPIDDAENGSHPAWWARRRKGGVLHQASGEGCLTKVGARGKRPWGMSARGLDCLNRCTLQPSIPRCSSRGQGGAESKLEWRILRSACGRAEGSSAARGSQS